MHNLLKRSLPLLVAALVLFPHFIHAKEPIRILEDCTVTKVADGDTLTAICSGTKVKVRLYGIDAPETEKMNKKTGRISKPGQPYGEEAYDALRSKVYRKTVKLDVMDIDRYKRTVGIVWVMERNINKEMVAEGWAWAYRQYLDRPHASEYIEAEEGARGNGLGLWKQNNPLPPWEFRRVFRSKNRR